MKSGKNIFIVIVFILFFSISLYILKAEINKEIVNNNNEVISKNDIKYDKINIKTQELEAKIKVLEEKIKFLKYNSVNIGILPTEYTTGTGLTDKLVKNTGNIVQKIIVEDKQTRINNENKKNKMQELLQNKDTNNYNEALKKIDKTYCKKILDEGQKILCNDTLIKREILNKKVEAINKISVKSKSTIKLNDIKTDSCNALSNKFEIESCKSNIYYELATKLRKSELCLGIKDSFDRSKCVEENSGY